MAADGFFSDDFFPDRLPGEIGEIWEIVSDGF